MPAPLSQLNVRYTPLSTIGTTTVEPGAPPQDPGLAGRYCTLYGVQCLSGTAFGVAVYDMQVVVTGTGTITNTNTLITGTITAGQSLLPLGGSSQGVRVRGGLVVVTTGTGTGNLAWD